MLEPRLLELVPIDPVLDQPPAKPKAAAPPRPTPEEITPIEITDVPSRPTPPASDKFVSAAKVEFEKGHVDQPLWDHAVAQTKGDRVAAIAFYLNARATSLRVLERERPGHPVGTLISTGPSRRVVEVATAEAPKVVVPARAQKQNSRVMAALGAAGALFVAGAAWYFLHGSEAPKTTAMVASPAVSTAAPPRAESAKATAKAAELDADTKAIGALIAKIDLLRSSENWNVHVLYAREWTRKEPGNAAAWNELGVGFEKLRQFDDAYAAAQKAVELAPTNALYWRNLGLLDVELNLPDEALSAFGKAVAANDQDIQSLVQIGLLNIRLGRLGEAKAMLDKALLANADDDYTQCLKTLVARGPVAPKPVAPVGRQTEVPLRDMCRSPTETAAPATVASVPTPASKASARGKR